MLDDVPTRVCSRCKVEKPLTVEFFRRDSAKNQWFKYRCKQCQADELTPEQKAQKNIRSKSWASHLNKSSESKQKHQAVKNAWAKLQHGTLVKPNQCSRCGSNHRVEGHHHKGYDKEHQYDVVWLCRKCHALIHSLARDASRNVALTGNREP